MAVQYLFTVNSGSNTAVVFKIDPHDLLCPKMIGSPAPVAQEFPVSITYSRAINTGTCETTIVGAIVR